MTISISIKINDGVVLASDSASTVSSPQGVLNVYNAANKIFNLRKGLPIGAITWGLGNIGHASIETVAKDFRAEAWDALDPTNYTMEEVAEEFATYVYDRYREVFEDVDQTPGLGFMVVGYPSGGDLAEEFLIRIGEGGREGPERAREREEVGLTWNGEVEPITRLHFGLSNTTGNILQDALGLDDDRTEQVINHLMEEQRVPLVVPSMPIQDAIDLGKFLVDFVVRFSRYRPGHQTVGGPIEIAAVTKHEGFRWAQRKHDHRRELNPHNPP